MIYTITMNPAIDETIEVDRLVPDGAGRVLSISRQAAGKGINVGRALATLGHVSEQAALLGAWSREYFESELAAEKLTLRPFCYEGATRVSRTLVFRENGFHTHLREIGLVPEDAPVGELAAWLDKVLAPGDHVVLAGSLPAGVDEGAWADLVRIVNAKAALAFLDTSGEPLSRAIDATPFCLKINLEEFLEYTEGGHGPKDFKQAAAQLAELGISLVLITMGADGALLFDGERYLFARLPEEKRAADVPLVRYGVGGGDSFLAGFLSGVVDGKPLEQALALGAACGAANALGPGSAVFSLEDVERLGRKVAISRE